MGLLLIVLLGLCGLAIEEVAPRFPSWTLFAAAGTVRSYVCICICVYVYIHKARCSPRTSMHEHGPAAIRTQPATSLQPDCNQTATRLQPARSRTRRRWSRRCSRWVAYTYSLLTHDSLTTHYSLQVVATLLGWVVLSVASVVPSRHAPWASSGTLLWIDKCCINQETPETIKAARTSVCSATYFYLLSSDLLLTTCYLLLFAASY